MPSPDVFGALKIPRFFKLLYLFNFWLHFLIFLFLNFCLFNFGSVAELRLLSSFGPRALGAVTSPAAERGVWGRRR